MWCVDGKKDLDLCVNNKVEKNYEKMMKTIQSQQAFMDYNDHAKPLLSNRQNNFLYFL